MSFEELVFQSFFCPTDWLAHPYCNKLDTLYNLKLNVGMNYQWIYSIAPRRIRKTTENPLFKSGKKICGNVFLI